MTDEIFEILSARFGEAIDAPADDLDVPEAWRVLAARRSHRRFLDRPLEPVLIETLAALALSAPSNSDLEAKITAYDAHRPYETQRDEAAHGHDPADGWSEDKARQYATPERADFGVFIRAKGFS